MYLPLVYASAVKSREKRLVFRTVIQEDSMVWLLANVQTAAILARCVFRASKQLRNGLISTRFLPRH